MENKNIFKEWARMTIVNKLKFGLEESDAIKSRERRVNGVLITVLDEINKLNEIKGEV